MKTIYWLGILGAVALYFSAFVPAKAAMPCGPRAEIVAQLKKGYDEIRRAAALTKEGSLLEIFVSPTGSFSVLISGPTGKSCLVTAGEGWTQDAVPIPGSDS